VPPEEVDEAWLDQPTEVAAPSYADSIAQRMHSVRELREPSLSDAPWEPQQALLAEEKQAMDWAAETPPSVQLGDPTLEAPTSASVPLEPDEADGEEGAEAPIPSFVKQAQRKAWWSKPAVRFAMGMLVIFLPLALLLQVAMHERNTLVAWKPQWRPIFESMCVALRCELSARKSIASVVLTGSSFNQDARPNHYRLGLSIQNQAPTLVATPAVELTLTDAQDQVLVRKVFNPDEIGAPAELAPHGEWNGTLPVATQGLYLQVSGYRVLAFYP